MALSANWLIFLRESQPALYAQYNNAMSLAQSDEQRLTVATEWAMTARVLLTKHLYYRQTNMPIE